MVQDGALDGIPVQEGSLFIQGLKNMTWQKHQHKMHQHHANGLLVVVFIKHSVKSKLSSTSYSFFFFSKSLRFGFLLPVLDQSWESTKRGYTKKDNF